MNSNAELNQSDSRAPWPWYAAAVLCFALDRALKAFALSGVSYGTRGIAEFTLFMNTGIAFSLPVPEALFWPMALAALAALTYAFARQFRKAPVTAGIIFFVLAGAFSNLIDRAFRDAVVDYLLFFGRSAVNLADGMILGGLLMLALRRE